MRLRTSLLSTAGVLALAACADTVPTGIPAPAAATASTARIGINVVLKAAPTSAALAKLGTYGQVGKVIPEINAVFMRAEAGQLSAIQALPEVAAANPDAERHGAPIDAVSVADFENGANMWNLDAFNVTNPIVGRTLAAGQDGAGVYVGVLDTGLLDSWRQYFPEQRIAVQYAKAFAGGLAATNVAEPTNQWEHDQNSHGTHVTSTILGFQLNGATRVNGVAPQATVIPVKVLGQSGSGQSSMVAEGIVYIADLKRGALKANPVVINMSLGGSVLDAVEKAAIDYAVASGVIIVASAGNGGTRGMGYPGAYAPVISVGNIGWRSQFSTTCAPTRWWMNCDVPEPGRRASSYADNFFVAPSSARQKDGQELDVLAPGTNVVGPYQLNSGTALSFYYLTGTSMSSPHVAGIAALMAQRNPALTASQAESILRSTALPMGAGTATGIRNLEVATTSWGTDATGHGIVTADAALAGTPAP